MEHTARWHRSKQDLPGTSAMNKLVRTFKHETTFGARITVLSLGSFFVDHVSWSCARLFSLYLFLL